MINSQIQLFEINEGYLPSSLNDLIEEGYIDTIDDNEAEDMIEEQYLQEIEGWIVYNAIEVKPGEKETDSGYTDYPNAWR